MVNKRILSDKFKSLLNSIYLKSIDYSKAWGTWRNTKRFHEFGTCPTICSPRRNSSNDYFWKYLLSDQDPHEYDGTHRETLPEWVDIIDYLKNDSNKKINDEQIEWAVGNFCVDILSNIKTFSLQTSQKVFDMVDNKIDKFYNDVFSNTLDVDLYVPVYNFRSNNKKIQLTIKKQIIENKKILPLDSREKFDFMIYYRKNIIRNDFYQSKIMSEKDRKEIRDIIYAISLYDVGLPYVRSVYYSNTFIEHEKFQKITLNLDSNEHVINVSNNATNNFRLFILLIMNHIDNLNKNERIKTSFERYLNTFDNHEFEYKLLDLVIAFEVLFGGGGRNISTWISLRAAKLLGSLTNEKPITVLNDIRLLYSTRNMYVHNGLISTTKKRQLLSRFPHLQRYILRSIRCMMFLIQNEKYEQLIDKLDALIEETSIPIDWISLPKRIMDHF